MRLKGVNLIKEGLDLIEKDEHYDQYESLQSLVYDIDKLRDKIALMSYLDEED